MLFLKKNKDGGPLSNTTAFWLWEIKWLFSIGLLRFEGPSRDVFHNHAFNCIGIVLSGCLLEEFPPYSDSHEPGYSLMVSGTSPLIHTTKYPVLG